MYITVLGGGIDLKGNLPSHVYQRLDKAIELFHKHPNSTIILSGKHSFLYKNQKPPLTEAKKMSLYLIEKGIPKKQILLEQQSKDTVGNAYYLKKTIFIPRNIFESTIITSHFHLERVKLIFKKIFGQLYNFQLIGIQETLPEDEEKKVVARQIELIEKMKILFKDMQDGDHNFLKGKLYKVKFYTEKRPVWVTNFVAKGK